MPNKNGPKNTADRNTQKRASKRSRQSRARGDALHAIQSGVAAVIQGLRTLFANRSARCEPRCPGWKIDDQGDAPVVERCEACIELGDYGSFVERELLELLPEVQSALDKVRRARAIENDE